MQCITNYKAKVQVGLQQIIGNGDLLLVFLSSCYIISVHQVSTEYSSFGNKNKKEKRKTLNY